MIKKLLIAAAGLAIAVFFLVGLFRPVARVVAVTSGQAVKAVPGSVNVQAEFTMELKSEIGGRINRSDLAVGSQVDAGAVLAQIDTGDLALEIEKTEEEFAAAKERIAVGSAIQLDLDTQKDSLVNLERLTKAGNYPPADLERERRRLKQTEQRLALEKVANQQLLDGYENTLKVLHRRLAKMTITAPFEGVVSAVFARPGDLIGANAPIATLIATSRTVEAKISQEDFADVKVGQKATVRFLGRENDTFDATVRQILPTAEVETQRYLVHLDVKCPPAVLVPGLTGEVNIIVGERAAKALVPRRALFGNNVYAVQDGRVQLRKVAVGYVSLNVAEITQGLAPGDRVLVEDLDRFRDGDRVKPEPAK
jgi:RND family efflux transporter MFP subunit